jgi:Uma2 family endonuclease
VVLYASDWIVSEDTVVRPDIMIVCEPIKGEHVTTPPVLALEILSPSSILKDRNTKFNLYQAFGVKYYILASVEKAEVEIFELKDNRYHQLNSNQFQFTNSCTVRVDFEDLFSNT